VPVQENYRWELMISSNLPAQAFELNWLANLPAAFAPDKRLVLYDPVQHKTVNLLEAESYRLWVNGHARVVVLYGSAEFVQSHLKPAASTLGPVAPNPFSDQTTIALGLADSPTPYQVQVNVHNLNGQPVRQLASATYPAGTYSLTWDGRDETGRRLPPGMYICRMVVQGQSGNQFLTQKIIIR